MSRIPPPPDIVIAGAAKAGTTALYWMLHRHPSIFMSPVKEPNYFSEMPVGLTGPGDQAHTERHIVRTANAYLELFAESPTGALRGDASPSYLFYHDSAARISAANPEARIVILLRDPVERAYSHYLNMVRDGRETLSFEAALDAEPERRASNWEWTWQYTGASRYSAGVRAFLGCFPDRVLVKSFEEFTAHPELVFSDVCSFLEIELLASPPRPEQRNPSGVPRSRILQRFLSTDLRMKRMLKAVLPRRALSRAKDLATSANVVKPKMPDEARRRLCEELGPDADQVRAVTGLEFASWCV